MSAKISGKMEVDEVKLIPTDVRRRPKRKAATKCEEVWRESLLSPNKFQAVRKAAESKMAPVAVASEKQNGELKLISSVASTDSANKNEVGGPSGELKQQNGVDENERSPSDFGKLLVNNLLKPLISDISEEPDEEENSIELEEEKPNGKTGDGSITGDNEETIVKQNKDGDHVSNNQDSIELEEEKSNGKTEDGSIIGDNEEKIVEQNKDGDHVSNNQDSIELEEEKPNGKTEDGSIIGDNEEKIVEQNKDGVSNNQGEPKADKEHQQPISPEDGAPLSIETNDGELQ